jgi:hypothetical protein
MGEHVDLNAVLEDTGSGKERVGRCQREMAVLALFSQDNDANRGGLHLPPHAKQWSVGGLHR